MEKFVISNNFFNTDPEILMKLVNEKLSYIINALEIYNL